MAKNTIQANKLQEVILAKTMNSIAGVKEEAPKTSKKAEPKPKKDEKPAPKTKAPAATKAPKEKKETKAREVKYIYPEDCTGSLDKKKFRAEFRAKVHKLEADIAKAKDGSKEHKKLVKELKEYKAQYLRG